MTRVSPRFALHATLAVSLPLLALAGCQSPSAAPALGPDAQQAEAYPGTTGHLYTNAAGETASQSELESPALSRYVASPTELKVGWVAASVNNASAGRAIDGNTDTHWSSGTATKPVFRLVLSARAELSSLKLKLNPNVGTYTVEVSDDAQTWKGVRGQRARCWWQQPSGDRPMTRAEIERTWTLVQRVTIHTHYVGGRLAETGPQMDVDLYEAPDGVRVAQLSVASKGYRVSDDSRSFPRDFTQEVADIAEVTPPQGT